MQNTANVGTLLLTKTAVNNRRLDASNKNEVQK